MANMISNHSGEISTNILFFGPWPPPFGGIASNIFELVPGISAAGYSIATLSLAEHSSECVEPRPNLFNERFSPRHYFIKNIKSILIFAWSERHKRFGLSIQRYLRAVTIAHKINEVVATRSSRHVFIYDNDQLPATPFIAKNIKGYPRVYATIYTGFILHQDRYVVEKEFLRYAVKSTDIMLSCSKYCLESFRDFLGIDHPAKVLYNNVDHLLYKPSADGKKIRDRFGIKDKDIVLMTMARMDQDLGYDFLLANLQSILDLNQNLNVLMVGATGPMRNMVELASKSHRRVHCAFDISFEEKPLFFAACDIFTAPSRNLYACLGIANIEAMMSGKAVLSSSSGGHPEVIEDGVSGLLIPFNGSGLDLDLYLKALDRLSKSQELRLFLGSAARHRALQKFTNEKITDEHLALIKANEI